MLFRLSGDVVLAGFGLGPRVESPPIQAVKTAFEVVRKTRELGREQERRDEPSLQVGIAVVTGPVVLGVLGRRRWRRWSVLGTSVGVVERLEELALSDEVLVDGPTFQALAKDVAEQFQPSPRMLRGESIQTPAYSWRGR